MIVRHLVADLGLAALIAIPAVLPAAPTPRSIDSHLAAEQPTTRLAAAAPERLAAASPTVNLQRLS
jgi:hypothetical protein